MIGTPAIRNLIREGKIAQMYSAIQTGRRSGMQTLDQCLTELVAQGRGQQGRGALQGAEQGRAVRRARSASWIANKPSS